MLIKPSRLALPISSRPTPALTLTRRVSNIAQRKAESHQSAGWAGTCTNGGETKHYIGGQWVEVGDQAERWFEVRDPVSRDDTSGDVIRSRVESD